MLRRMIVPLLFGLIGAAILIGLGQWQLQRMAWKEGVLAGISARLTDAPAPLPATPDPVADLYLPVEVTGQFTGEDLDVLASFGEAGAGFRVIAAFETAEGRRILIDRGFVADEARALPRIARAVTVTGTLHWPRETDAFTPAPDRDSRMWFSRDVPGMAEALRTDPVMVVARSDTGDGIAPVPVGTEGIPNNHLQYAITWFSLAVVWLGMTGLLLWRIRRRID